MTQSSPKICILGGGFGGLYTALRLSQLPWPEGQRAEMVLVDQHDHFLFSPFLYELVTGELQAWEIAPPFLELLAETGVQFIQATVQHIDPTQHQVTLGDDRTLGFDRLVLALGGETPRDGVPGARDHALPFRTVADAYQLEARLRTLENAERDYIRVAIAGAGPSGVELACKLAERLGDRGRIRIVDRGASILASAPEFNQQTALKALEERGVWLDLETTVDKVEADQLTLTYKNQTDTIPVDLVLWTVGTAIAAPIRDLKLPHNPRGQLLTTPTLQVQDHPEIYALGDLADCRDAQGQQIPGTAQAALQQADCVAWNAWASLTERPLLSFRYTHLGEMLTLGASTAALTGLGLKLEGPAAYLARRLVYLYRMPTLEHQLKVGLHWLAKPLISLLVP